MMTYPLITGPQEIIIIAAVILLLFGGKKIPELMKGLGKGVKSFKEGMNEVENEVKDAKKEIAASTEEKPIPEEKAK